MMTLLGYSAIMVIVVIGILWMLGRGRDFRMRNDEIFEIALRKKMREFEDGDIV